ncbi:MAG: hypothetical protein J7M27_12925 [Candidatus Latescibacteria bacterium]|nr:hypothetical protein [Candidatus Latescibacterota bacterium]
MHPPAGNRVLPFRRHRGVENVSGASFDDLDLFVNDRPEFALWVDRIFDALSRYPEGKLDIILREKRFSRCVLVREELTLKLELINDVPSHIGLIRDHPSLGSVDSAENILANKITALMDRDEPKDIADIWAFYVKMGLSIHHALEGAGSEAVGIFPPDVARALYQVNEDVFWRIKWIDPPSLTEFHQQGLCLRRILLY